MTLRTSNCLCCKFVVQLFLKIGIFCQLHLEFFLFSPGFCREELILCLVLIKQLYLDSRNLLRSHGLGRGQHCQLKVIPRRDIRLTVVAK